jgi:hypothetical protein
VAVERDKHHCLSIAAQFFGPCGERAEVDSVFLEEGTIPKRDLPSIHRAGHALSCQ